MKKMQELSEKRPFDSQSADRPPSDQRSMAFCQVGGMDIVGPIPPATGKRRFLIVVVEYFTKCIEAEPLAKIMAANV